MPDLLHELGVDISHETTRFWWNRFGPTPFSCTLLSRATFVFQCVVTRNWQAIASLFDPSLEIRNINKLLIRCPRSSVCSNFRALNRSIMVFTGFIELFGAIAIAIWFQGEWIGTLGALALLGTSVGAIFCHLVFDTWKDGVPAMITGTLSAFIVWLNREPLLAFVGVPGLI
jgi:hypothetical protein